MTDRDYIVSYVSGGKRIYLASPDMNDKTTDRDAAYRTTREDAEKRAKHWQNGGHRQVRHGRHQ